MICSTQLKSTSKARRFCALYPEFCESQLSLARHSLDNPVFMCIHILVKYSKSTFCQRCALPQFSPISSLVNICKLIWMPQILRLAHSIEGVCYALLQFTSLHCSENLREKLRQSLCVSAISATGCLMSNTFKANLTWTSFVFLIKR